MIKRIKQGSLEWIGRDVQLVKEKARGIIAISSDNASYSMELNDDYSLGVLAIIGPSEFQGMSIEQCLLAEVGISRSRPYHEASGIARKKGERKIIPRKKVFYLSDTQYSLVAPAVFNFLLDEAKGKVSKRDKVSDFSLPCVRHYWSHRSKKMFHFFGHMDVLQGARFSFSRQDFHFIRDLYWAELNINKQLQKCFSGAAGFVDKRLKRYREKRVAYSKRRKRFCDLNGARDIMDECVGKYPLYQRREILDRIRDREKNIFYDDLERLFGLRGLPELSEQRLAREAEKFADPEARLGGIQIKTIQPKLRKSEARKGKFEPERRYVTFEIFPYLRLSEFLEEHPDRRILEEDFYKGYPF